MADCVCGSGKEKEACCLRFILGEDIPLTAEALMRSRYTAFVLKNKEYLIKTWHKKKTLGGEQLFDPNLEWVSLEIIETVKGQAGDSSGIVEFKASFNLLGQETILHERSEFVKKQNLWYYTRGQHK